MIEPNKRMHQRVEEAFSYVHDRAMAGGVPFHPQSGMATAIKDAVDCALSDLYCEALRTKGWSQPDPRPETPSCFQEAENPTK